MVLHGLIGAIPLTTYPGPAYNYIVLGDGAQAPS